MQERIFEHQIRIAAAPDAVYAILSDFRQAARLNPLVQQIEALPPEEARRTGYQYRITDLIPFGPFRISIRYLARTALLGGGAIRSEALQQPNVFVSNEIRIRQDGGGTLVTERMTLRAPALLMGMSYRMGTAAHAAAFQRLKAWLETGQPEGQ
ncbi:MAG: SRPBCC family protein [Bacteroidia bacterium]|nr:SRPBCC family protein [Bacteroidia bacterium]